MRLKEIRESRGIKQSQAALGLNLSPSLYNRYENGTREIPNVLLPVIANYYGVTVDELFGIDAADGTKIDIPKTPQARILANGIDQMPERERERALNIVRLMFDQYANLFEEKEKSTDDDGT